MKNPIILLLLAATTIGAITSCKKLVTNPVTPPPTVTPTVDSLKVGLILYYPYNNSGVDSSGTGNDAFVYHNLTSTTNRFNQANTAFSFDGTTSYMIVKDNAGLRLNNTDYTLNIWVNLAEYNSSYGTEVLCKRGAGNNNGWNYGITGYLDQSNGMPLGVNSLQVSGGLDPLALGAKAIGLNQWHMLTTVYNVQKKQISFYIDGVLDKTSSNIPSPNVTATADLYIGQDSQTSGGTAYYLKGKLDDIRIYNRAISTSQIQKLFTLPY
jgi:hypothetical protein